METVVGGQAVTADLDTVQISKKLSPLKIAVPDRLNLRQSKLSLKGNIVGVTDLRRVRTIDERTTKKRTGSDKSKEN
jgi:hypothetical protein